MSFDKIKKMLEEQDGDFDRYEHTLKQIVEDLDKSIGTLNSILEDEGYGASDSVISKAKAMKEHLTEAINLVQGVTEEFDGTLSDLGEPPKAALSVVNAGGGASKLAGYAGIVKSKRKKHKKSKKHESSEDKCPDCGHRMFNGECPNCGFRQVDAYQAAEFYDKKKKSNEELKLECSDKVQYLKDRKKEIQGEIEKMKIGKVPEGTSLAQLHQQLDHVNRELDTYKSEEPNESLSNMQKINRILNAKDEDWSGMNNQKTPFPVSHPETQYPATETPKMNNSNNDDEDEFVVQQNKATGKYQISYKGARIGRREFNSDKEAHDEIENLVGIYSKEKPNEDHKPGFEIGDKIKVIKGANKDVEGIAQSSDVDLTDKEDAFQAKGTKKPMQPSQNTSKPEVRDYSVKPVQQAIIKPKLGDVDQYHVIDTKDKVKKSK